MKKLLLLISAVALTGCSTLTSVYDAYFMAKFDTNEYSLINQVKTKAIFAQDSCYNLPIIKEKINDLFATTTEFRNFTFHIPHNEDATNMAGRLVALVNETREHYHKNNYVSPLYCKVKLQQIASSADQIQSMIGSKPR
jgi:hypothetical protein